MERNGFLSPIIWGLALIITALVLGNSFKNRNANDDIINVIGLGTKDFLSDEVLWTGSFSSKSMDAKEAYSKILEDKTKVESFFKAKGFTSEEFSFGGIQIEKLYKTVYIETANRESRTESIFDGYLATQSVTFNSIKNEGLMKKIESVSEQTAELINSGIEFMGRDLQYTYSNLASLKYNLIEDATKDARERASKIVKKGKGDLGKLKTATLGVFQITAKGSEEEDTYGGILDTRSKWKTARITVRLSYILD
ncbi:MAG TPA: SIMPL domain-containing protein [Edaphocola sp.]|nr:SIMPL domain-containing protein [Edaphocola sp.]